MNKIIIVSGPTATGKTKTSIEIAKTIINGLHMKAVVVNFDSLVFYKELSIGTAKPTVQEMDGVEHFLVGFASINSPMNASNFIAMGEEIINTAMKEKKVIILVGGSAFYLRALLKGMYESTSTPQNIKECVDNWYESGGIEVINDYLRKHDPDSIINYHENDHYRLMRAVEHFEATGTKISIQKKFFDEMNPYDFSEIIHPWEVLHIYLDIPRDEHFQIITNRTKKMFDDGLLDEIDQLEKSGFNLEEKPLASIGYKESIEFRKGISQFKNVEQCIERISISTRQLAKSQRTFFNRITPKESFNPINDQAKIMDRVAIFLKAKS